MSDVDEQRQRAREAREALVGRTVAGKYVLRALLGHGGMGAVYEAEHQGIGKRVAIKFVDPEFATDEQVVKRFSREARAMSAIESAHIVTVFDAGTEDGRPYLVMELLRGEDLGQRLRRARRVPLGESMHIIAQVLKGLARAHAAGIVHRDLKPDNIFIAKTDTDPLFAKIVDFGISKIERPRATTSPLALTGRGTVLGTPLYMSPEQAQCAADVDGRADLYSVGAILFECLSGRPPHTGETYEQIILSICMREAPDLRAIEPSISEDVSKFVARALVRDKMLRYTSAERMLAALHEVAPEERMRVPLDPPAPQTMISAGGGVGEIAAATISTPMEVPLTGGVATRVGVALLEPLPPSSGKSAAKEKTRNEPQVAPAVTAPPPRRTKSTPQPPPKSRTGMLVMTAALATLTGIGATFGIIYMTSKDPQRDQGASKPRNENVAVSATTTGVHETTSATAPAASSAPPEIPSAEPTLKPSATATAKPSTLPTLPQAGRATSKPTAPPKPLDIQRDLPP
jgi:serine/threonine-protein kinase